MKARKTHPFVLNLRMLSLEFFFDRLDLVRLFLQLVAGVVDLLHLVVDRLDAVLVDFPSQRSSVSLLIRSSEEERKRNAPPVLRIFAAGNALCSICDSFLP